MSSQRSRVSLDRQRRVSEFSLGAHAVLLEMLCSSSYYSDYDQRSGKAWVSGKYFSYFSTKTYVVGTH